MCSCQARVIRSPREGKVSAHLKNLMAASRMMQKPLISRELLHRAPNQSSPTGKRRIGHTQPTPLRNRELLLVRRCKWSRQFFSPEKTSIAKKKKCKKNEERNRGKHAVFQVQRSSLTRTGGKPIKRQKVEGKDLDERKNSKTSNWEKGGYGTL